MRGFSLFSGGKDSTAASTLAVMEGLDIDTLVTVFPDNVESYMFHTVNLWITSIQAYLSGREILYYSVSGVREREVDELRTLLSFLWESGYEIMVVGGLLSRYQRSRLEKLSNEYGFKLYAPFWGVPQDEILHRYVDLGIRFMIVSVSAMGLDRKFLGWVVDSHDKVDTLVELGSRYGFNPTGEGGEYESLAISSPMFKGVIKPIDYEMHWDGYSGYIEIKEVAVEKPINRSQTEVREFRDA